MFPNKSTFNSDAPGSAWWTVQDGASSFDKPLLFISQWGTILTLFQTHLKAILPPVYAVNNDGTCVGGDTVDAIDALFRTRAFLKSDLVADGVFGTKTVAAFQYVLCKMGLQAQATALAGIAKTTPGVLTSDLTRCLLLIERPWITSEDTDANGRIKTLSPGTRALLNGIAIPPDAILPDIGFRPNMETPENKARWQSVSRWLEGYMDPPSLGGKAQPWPGTQPAATPTTTTPTPTTTTPTPTTTTPPPVEASGGLSGLLVPAAIVGGAYALLGGGSSGGGGGYRSRTRRRPVRRRTRRASLKTTPKRRKSRSAKRKHSKTSVKHTSKKVSPKRRKTRSVKRSAKRTPGEIRAAKYGAALRNLHRPLTAKGLRKKRFTKHEIGVARAAHRSK